MDRFRTMESFVRVVRAGSFTVAARQLGLSRAIVSRHIAALEARLGIRLLKRSTRSLSLTEEGQRLYDIMRPQSGKVADYLFSDLSDAETAQLGTILTRLIDTLEARDEQGRSLFLETTKP